MRSKLRVQAFRDARRYLGSSGHGIQPYSILPPMLLLLRLGMLLSIVCFLLSHAKANHGQSVRQLISAIVCAW